MKKVVVGFLLAVAMISASQDAFACGSHGCVSVSVGIGGGYYGGGYYGGYPLVGGGAVAFRRSRRLARRANRAAFFGFYGRANRLAFRSQAAFNRGAFRAGYFGRRFCC